jgi:hypothetical protein
LVRFLPLFVPLSIIFRWLLIWTYHYTICNFSCDNPFIANHLFITIQHPYIIYLKGLSHDMDLAFDDMFG